jgi:hypothetical protein
MSSSLLSMVAAAMFATHATAAQPALQHATAVTAQRNAASVTTLTGCINRDAATPGSRPFSGTSTGARLSGFDGRKDAGQRGETVVGTGSRRLTIRGGLVPSANVAAQASALDPAKAAVASRLGGTHHGMGTTPVPELRPGRGLGFSGWCP